MIEGKKRIKADLLQFSLPGDAASSAFHPRVLSLWMVLEQVPWIVRVLIGKPLGSFAYDGGQGLKKRVPPGGPHVGSGAVFSKCDLGQVTFRGHARDLKIKDFPGFRIHRKRDAKRLTFTVFARFQIIELNEIKRRFRELLQPLFVLQARSRGEKPKLSHDRFPIYAQQDGRSPLGNSRT
jgi:hypothetical protein